MKYKNCILGFTLGGIIVTAVFLFSSLSAEEVGSAETEPGELTPEGTQRIDQGITIEDINSEGEKQWQVIGTDADFFQDGYIQVRNVRATFYEDKGKEIRLTTDVAKVNQETKKVESQEFVEIETDEMVITGTGLDGELDKRKLKVLNDVTVVISAEVTKKYLKKERMRKSETKLEEAD